MADKRLVDYVKDNLAKGHSLNEIRDFVRRHGWTDREFDEAVLEASGAPSDANFPGFVGQPGEKKQKEKKGHKKLIIAVIILIILIWVFLMTAANIVNYFKDMFPNNALPFNMSIFG